jgi:hypothetical protein
MLFLFRNKAEQKQDKRNAAQDKIAISIVSKCIRLKSRLADYMQRKSDRLSSTVKKYWLISFCLLAVGCSLYVIVHGFRTPSDDVIYVSHIKLLEHSTKTGEANKQPSMIVTKDAFDKVQRFRYHMDSLSRSPSGKRTHDSILASRPGLIDSVLIIEEMYKITN